MLHMFNNQRVSSQWQSLYILFIKGIGQIGILVFVCSLWRSLHIKSVCKTLSTSYKLYNYLLYTIQMFMELWALNHGLDC